MAVAAPGPEARVGLEAGTPADALPEVRQTLTLTIPREDLLDNGEVPKTTAVRVGRVRLIATAKLRLWGLSALTDDTLLLISELVTNGLRYGVGRQIVFRLVLSARLLMVEVDDSSPARPEIREATPDAVRGRGLILVDALAGAWGVSEDGTRTWCALEVPAVEGDPS